MKTQEYMINRLLKVYDEHDDIIIGVDFDNTIKPQDPFFNDLCRKVRKTLESCSKLGLTICLYTICETTEQYQEKLKYCNDNNINISFNNKSNVMKDQYHINPYKPFFNILLDDKAGLEESLEILIKTVETIKYAR